MAGSLKTEARRPALACATARPTASCTSIPRTRGRMGAIAKGVRRTRSRFGGRLEPFFRLRLVLHEGRSDLLTVTGAETVERLRAPARGRRGARRRRARLRRGRAPVRRPPSRSPAVFHLLCNELALLDARRRPLRRRTPTSSRSGSSCCSPRASRRSWPRARRAASASTSSASRAPRAASSARRARRRRSRSARRRTRSWSTRSARPLAEAPGGRRRGRCARPSARSPRRSSTTPTSACARRSPG